MTWNSHRPVNKDSSLLGYYAVLNVQEKLCWGSMDPEDPATDFSEMAVTACHLPFLI